MKQITNGPKYRPSGQATYFEPANRLINQHANYYKNEIYDPTMK